MDDLIGLHTSLELNRDPLHERIADHLQKLIAESQFEPGTQLPSRRDLAQSLGVSQATISGAIRLLEQRGLVETKSGSGTYIADRATSVFAESMERLFHFSSCTDEDLITFREMLEPSIATLAAQQATPEDVAKLRTLLEQVEEAHDKGDSDTSATADAAFHQALAEATRNALVIAVAAGLQEVLQSVLKAQDQAIISAYGGRDHRAIYDAVADHDPKGARAAMAEHMSLFRLAMEQMIRERAEPV